MNVLLSRLQTVRDEIDNIMGYIIASGAGNFQSGVFAAAGSSSAAFVGTSSSVTNSVWSATGSNTTAFVGVSSGSNPWDLPTATATVTMSGWTQALLQTAWANEAAFHAAAPTSVYRINAPAGTPSFNATSALTFTPQGPSIFDQKSCQIVQNGAHTVSYMGSLLWKKACTVSTSGGLTTVTPTSGTWPTTPVVGDVGRLASKHRFFGDDSYSQSYMGELMEVQSFNSGTNTITFTGLAFRQTPTSSDQGGAAYTAADNPHFCMMNRSAQLWLQDFKMLGASTQADQLLQLRTLWKPMIIRPFLDTCANSLLIAIGNYGGYIVDPHIEDGTFSGTELTYGINEQCNKNLTVQGTTAAIHITRTRNPVDSNILHIGAGKDPLTASLTDLAQWGPSVDTVVDGINIEDMKSNGSSTHSGTVRRIWRNIHWTRTGTVPLSDTAPMIGAPRGKYVTFDNWNGTNKSGIQYYAYDADPSAPAAGVPRDGEYRDSSDVTIQNSTYEITGGSGTNGWMFCSPTAGATLDGEVVIYSRFDGLIHQNNTVTLSGSNARAVLPLCGTMLFSGDTIKLNAVLSGAIWTLTRPSATVIGTNTIVTFTNVTLDLQNYPSSSGTITAVSCGTNCTATGTITVINKPAGVSVTKSGSGASGLTIVGG